MTFERFWEICRQGKKSERAIYSFESMRFTIRFPCNGFLNVRHNVSSVSSHDTLLSGYARKVKQYYRHWSNKPYIITCDVKPISCRLPWAKYTSINSREIDAISY